MLSNLSYLSYPLPPDVQRLFEAGDFPRMERVIALRLADSRTPECLKERLPGCGVEVVELPRREADGQVISAGRVRALYREGRMEALRPLVPETTFEYLLRNPYREG